MKTMKLRLFITSTLLLYGAQAFAQTSTMTTIEHHQVDTPVTHEHDSSQSLESHRLNKLLNN